jgi:FmdE, Molybdenum formylmethanofuran dehydrogenase operon
MRGSGLAIGFGSAAFAFGIVAADAHPHSPSGDKSGSNRDHFIRLGEAVHGGFGPLIALGIRIGDDAMKTLDAGPRQLDVTYYAGPEAPCPCVVDGIMLVTASSPGQGTLRVSAEKAGEGEHGRVRVVYKRTGRAVEYVIPAGIDALVKDAMKGGPERRWSVIMDAPEAALFTRRIVERTQ